MVTVVAFPLYPVGVIVPMDMSSLKNSIVPIWEFNDTVVPTNSTIPSAAIVIFADGIVSIVFDAVVDISNAPFPPTVNVAVAPE